MQVLVARGRRDRLLPVRERSQGLPVLEAFRDKVAVIRAKARPGLLASLIQSHVTITISRACEEGLPSKARISGPWDALVPVISGTCINAVCSFSPQCGLEEPVSVPRCCISTFCYTEGSERLEHGSRLRTGLIG